MSASPSARDGDPAVLDDLVFRYLELLESSGTDPDRLLDEMCEDHAAQAADLRAAVDRLRASGLLPHGTDDFPEEIDDFKRRLVA